MKLYIKEATNTSAIPVNPDMEVIEAADDNMDNTLDDKINEVKDEFDYVIDGLYQINAIDADGLAQRLHETMGEFIQEIANSISE